MNKQQLEAYTRQLCKDKGYDEAKTTRAVAKALADFDSEDGSLLTELYDLPIKGSADYNKKVDELKAKAQGLERWHKGAQSAVDLAEQKRKEAEDRIKKLETKYGLLDDDESDDLPTPPNRGRKKQPSADELEQIKADVAARDAHYLNLMADAGDVIARHAKMFKGEIISTRDLLKAVGEAAADPINPRNITIEDAYLALHGDRVQQAEEADVKANEDRLRNEGREEVRKQFHKNGVRSGATISEEGIVFNALKSEDKKDDPDRNLSEQDRLALFAQELRVESDKRAQADA